MFKKQIMQMACNISSNTSFKYQSLEYDRFQGPLLVFIPDLVGHLTYVA